MDEEILVSREEMACEYEAIHNRLFVLQIIFVVVLLWIFQLTGASSNLSDGLVRRFGVSHWYFSNAVYILVTVFGFSACMFPFSYYSDYILEHYYGLSKETFAEWFSDFFKSLLIDMVVVTVLFSVIYALLRLFPDWWWLFASIFYVLVVIFFRPCCQW